MQVALRNSYTTNEQSQKKEKTFRHELMVPASYMGY